MRRYLFLVLVLSAAAGIYLLRFDPKPVLVEGLIGQPVNLDPVSGTQNEVDELIESVLFRSLLKYDSAGELVGDIAESYQVKEGKVYEVRLKEGLFWHDGKPITAVDVVYTFEQDPSFADVDVTAPEERTVVFELEDPLASFPSILTRPVAPAHLAGEQPDFSVIGSGDFKVQRVVRNGEVVEIGLRNIGEGELGELVFRFFDTQEGLEEAAKRGEVDSFVSDEFDHPSFTNYEAPLYGHYFAVFFNLEAKNALAKNTAFRGAAARKTPTTDLISDVLGGGGSPVRGPMSGTWAEGDLQFPQYSPDLEGGYTGKITITVPSVEKLVETAEILVEEWQELGIEVSVSLIDSSAIEEVVGAKNFEAILLGQKVDRDPDRYSLWHSTRKDYPGLNITSYEDPRADRALEEGRKVLERAARKQHYLNFQRLFLEDNPAVFLYHPALSYFVSRKFGGIDLSPVFVPINRFWNIQDWRKL
jgi:peptide/nickel transport system substrate-binding protein